ncbi:MAG: PfaD family polyunsaturated fatty acid/polyketide biosynthesis protein [Myxococcota bacterium]
MSGSGMSYLGEWTPSHGGELPSFAPTAVSAAAQRIRETCHVVRDPGTGTVGVAFGGVAQAGGGTGGAPWLASLPPLYPEWLGDRSFCEVHRTRFAYVAGAMANGIATTDLVVAMAQHGMLGFFGAAGLSRGRVEAALQDLQSRLGDRASWGSNLIHSPHEPELEDAIAAMYVRHGVKRVSASAYMALTPAIVHLAFAGVREVGGTIERQNYVFAKISRPEVARHFMSPPPKAILDKLVGDGRLTAEEARLAARLSVAEDIIVESDSGGHTDNQTLTALFPTILQLRDELMAAHGLTRPIRVGAAGGLGTPSAVAAAYALGAAFVLTGSVNQGAVESGLCAKGRELLAKAGLGDVTMAPAADMFEMGVKVQVLKRGTMFAPRAHKLYETYVTYAGMDDIPPAARERLEKRVLGLTLDEVWDTTRSFWQERDPREVAKAEADPKHKMALCFRWYLGLSSRWAIAGDAKRALDYQIWCGPAMGAFNAWVSGSFLEPVADRTAGQIALNLLEGAAVVTRAQQLRSYGVPMPAAGFQFSPRPLKIAGLV